jgi:hypothetical protein
MTKRLMSAGSVLGERELQRIANLVFTLSEGSVRSIQVEHIANVVTRVANNRVLLSDNGHRVSVYFPSRVGGRRSIEFNTNLIDEKMLRVALRGLNALGREQLGTDHEYFRDTPTPPQPFVPVSLWRDTTATAMETIGATAVPAMIRLLSRSGLRGSGFVGISARSVYACERGGITSFSHETDAECTVSARTPDGTASGWYGQANRDWAKISPEVVAERAIDMANRSKNPSAIEPGRRTAILSPFAVAQLMAPMSIQFDAFLTNEYQATTFTVKDDPARHNKVGLRVIDPCLDVISDPADPEGGYTPFGDMREDHCAWPTQQMQYIKAGVLQDLSFGSGYNLGKGKPFNQPPWSLRLQAVQGTPLLTVDEMIARCENGIYVNRFSHVEMVNGLAALETGVTRDGCFFVKDGKINRPVKNFRFLDSPIFALNRLVAIGKPERASLGYLAKASGTQYHSRWPYRPMIVPPMMVDDFNFNAMSDAV